MSRLGLEIEFAVVSCANCGVTFALTGGMEDQLRKSGHGFYCPNGHSLSFGNSLQGQLTKEREEKARLMKRLEQSERWTREARDETRAVERRLSATRGQVTRLRKRVQAGVCPYPGCRRHFSDLARHITSKHAHEPLPAEEAR